LSPQRTNQELNSKSIAEQVQAFLDSQPFIPDDNVTENGDADWESLEDGEMAHGHLETAFFEVCGLDVEAELPWSSPVQLAKKKRLIKIADKMLIERINRLEQAQLRGRTVRKMLDETSKAAASTTSLRLELSPELMGTLRGYQIQLARANADLAAIYGIRKALDDCAMEPNGMLTLDNFDEAYEAVEGSAEDSEFFVEFALTTAAIADILANWAAELRAAFHVAGKRDAERLTAEAMKERQRAKYGPEFVAAAEALTDWDMDRFGGRYIGSVGVREIARAYHAMRLIQALPHRIPDFKKVQTFFIGK